MEMDPDSTLDIISDLPGNVLESILVRLPIREAVRTSVLSSKWRYKWVTLPELVFDNKCIPPSSNEKTLINTKLINIVDQVLLLHKGHVRKFKLSNSYFQSCYNIDRWVLYLSWNNIKEFTLEIQQNEPYKLPSCLFSCQQLSYLKLLHCVFKPPPTFHGFTNLKTLDLQNITFADGEFESLISRCPLLEKLTLVDSECHQLKLHIPPNLKYLCIRGKFRDICLENATLLAFMLLHLFLSQINVEHLEQGETCNLIKVLGCVPSIEKLEVKKYSLQFLSVGNIPARLPTTCDRLRNISLVINYEDLNQILAVFCLFRSSPNLQQLNIWMVRSNRIVARQRVEDILDVQDDFDCCFNQLRTVEMCNIFGAKLEMQFIKFILANAPVLETISIEPNANVVDKGLKMLKELVRFRRASVQAEIVFPESDEP